MSTPHIHRDCIVLWAADPTRRTVHVDVERTGSWTSLSDSQRSAPYWHPANSYRVLDHKGKVLAETPPPKRMVRIPETVLPAPVTERADVEAIVYWSESGQWRASTAVRSTAPHSTTAAIRQGLAFATEEDAQQWADFLNTKWEEVSE